MQRKEGEVAGRHDRMRERIMEEVEE